MGVSPAGEDEAPFGKDAGERQGVEETDSEYLIVPSGREGRHSPQTRRSIQLHDPVRADAEADKRNT